MARSRLIKNCERLEANTKNLDPLREGDAVLVQSQIPNSPRSKKWDRQGTVVFTGENDQYLIKVAGTGRLTLRNRQFLRKFQPGPSKIVDTKSSMLRQCSPVAGNVAKPDDNVPVLSASTISYGSGKTTQSTLPTSFSGSSRLPCNSTEGQGSRSHGI